MGEAYSSFGSMRCPANILVGASGIGHVSASVLTIASPVMHAQACSAAAQSMSG